MIDYHDVTVRVRYAETDQMGVVYHSNYLIWFEVGRVELMRALGFDYKRMEIEDDTYIVVADVHCRYHHPARYDELLTRPHAHPRSARIAHTEIRLRTISPGRSKTARDRPHHPRCVQSRGPGRSISPTSTKHAFPSRSPRQLPEAGAPHEHFLNGNDLTFCTALRRAFAHESVCLSPDAVVRMKASRAVVDSSSRPAKLPTASTPALANSLPSAFPRNKSANSRSISFARTACGVGAPLSEPETRAMMLLRANALAKGLSGVRPVGCRNTVRDAERRRSSGDSFARLRRRFGRSRPACPSCRGGHRRRRSCSTRAKNFPAAMP